jgi:aspartokinase-like uncharacterized kinase
LVEALRKQSALWPLSEADYHHRALAMMDFNGQLFAQIYGLPSQDRAIALDDPPPIGVWTGSAQLILVSELEPSWRTTSDAVAAWLGWTLHCPVRIVKSVMPPNGIPMTLTEKSWLLWRNHFDEMTPVWVKRGVDITWIG